MDNWAADSVAIINAVAIAVVAVMHAWRTPSKVPPATIVIPPAAPLAGGTMGQAGIAPVPRT
jgi:hypothetical protein